MEQILSARFAVAAVQHKEVAALAQTTVKDFLAHDVPRMGDVHADKDNPDNLAFRIFNRLVLRDIALAEQKREATIDLPFGDSRKCRAGGIKNGSDGAVAILFTQRCSHADKIVTATDKQGRDGPRTAQEVIRKRIVFMQLRFAAFQQRNGKPVYGPALAAVAVQRLWQKGGEQTGIAFNLFAQAGVEHLYHIHHAGGLVMQVFNRKIFKLLAGVVAQQKSEQQKKRGDTCTC